MRVDCMNTSAKFLCDFFTAQALLNEFYDLKFGMRKYVSCHKEFIIRETKEPAIVTAVKMKTLMKFLKLRDISYNQ